MLSLSDLLGVPVPPNSFRCFVPLEENQTSSFALRIEKEKNISLICIFKRKSFLSLLLAALGCLFARICFV